MIYLKQFQIPSDLWACWYFTRDPKYGPPEDMPAKLWRIHPDNSSYHNTWYPWRVFENRFLQPEQHSILGTTCPLFHFTDITFFYGGNGSGKSTLLNVIAEKIHSERAVLHNTSPFFNDFVTECFYTVNDRLFMNQDDIPVSRIITSDEVFKQLLSKRDSNNNINLKRRDLRQEHFNKRYSEFPKAIDLSDIEQVKAYREIFEAKRHSVSSYINNRLNKTELEQSNGETGFHYFVESIRDDSLVLLDEPENSLSAMWQKELALFIQGAVREFRCQFIIATHSPFLLSIPDAKIYNLDTIPIKESKWNDLESMRCYFELFKNNEELFF